MVPAATDELLRHPLEVVDVVPVAGPARDHVSDPGLDFRQERGKVLPRPRRGRPVKDCRDVAVDSLLDEDPPLPELELPQVLLVLPERVPHEQHDRGEHAGEDVLVSVRPEPPRVVHDQAALPPDDEDVLEGVREA